MRPQTDLLTAEPLCVASEAFPESLDVIGRRFGTDLSSFGRDCLRHWEPFLLSLRDRPFDMLEIGVGGGESTRVWRAWFPRAHIVALDVRRVFLDPPMPGCILVQGRQTDASLLRQLVRRYRFRLVIDDGSPRAEDKIQTLLTLFPWLEPESIYICAGSALPGASIDSAAHTVAPDPAWFANLGLAVASCPPRREDLGPERVVEQVQALASGVSLLRGSVLVTN